MKTLILLCGPPGSGKSTYAKKYVGFVYVNQDSQGKQHLQLFKDTVIRGDDIVVDRMNFSKEQRSRYLDLAKANGYTTEIVVLHEPYQTCLMRCAKRLNHETIKNLEDAQSALKLFFTKYERVTDDEANKVNRIWPNNYQRVALIVDLDGTLCKTEHRAHFVQKPKGERKDWNSFFKEMINDTINEPVESIVRSFDGAVVLCSGRPDNYRAITEEWLKDHALSYDDLFMRHRNDQRPDNIIKEILLDFEILPRYKPFFILDDRNQVVEMWRKRGYTCMQVAPGEF